jgi:hypothetical protein
MDTEQTQADKRARMSRILTMLAFWILVWGTTPGWLTVTYLALTVSILGVYAVGSDGDFWSVLTSTRWVFIAVFLMAVVSFTLNAANPLVPPTPFERLWGWVTSSAPQEPIARHSFWRILNRLFFNRSRTYGWRQAGLIYAVWTIPAVFISFWKQMRDNKKEIAIVAGSLLAASVLSKRKRS